MCGRQLHNLEMTGKLVLPYSPYFGEDSPSNCSQPNATDSDFALQSQKKICGCCFKLMVCGNLLQWQWETHACGHEVTFVS